MREKFSSLQREWERILKNAGMASELPPENPGERVPIGLGIKTEKEERLEDQGGHSATCPLVLGYGISQAIDQPNDRPVEHLVLKRLG